jgi:hypothetical protein
LGLRHHPGGGVNRYTADVPPSDLNFAGVETCPQRQTDLLRGRAERQRTSHRAAGSIERRQNAVAGILDQNPAMLLDHLLGELIVAIQHPAPALVAHGGGAERGIHNVGKQHRGQNPLKLGRRTVAMAGDKFLDVAKQGFVLAGPKGVVGIVGIFNIFGAGNPRRQVTAPLHRNLSVGSTMQYKRRGTHGRKYRSDIDQTI